MRWVQGVQGRYEAGKRGVRQVQVKGVRGRYKAGKRGARQVQGR